MRGLYLYGDRWNHPGTQGRGNIPGGIMSLPDSPWAGIGGLELREYAGKLRTAARWSLVTVPAEKTTLSSAADYELAAGSIPRTGLSQQQKRSGGLFRFVLQLCVRGCRKDKWRSGGPLLLPYGDD